MTTATESRSFRLPIDNVDPTAIVEVNGTPPIEDLFRNNLADVANRQQEDRVDSAFIVEESPCSPAVGDGSAATE
ncbi:hypothetical protein [Halalkaliarchaeum desulfuricum]|uniref:hypothetical protein n=1 Tax=Halalkaliarchaeum desulfuricum TaxID=2055893 RepID=UPI001C3113DB|nr:hypothetical protein [Halalkaliarchaeum desulfuricum]